MRLPNGFGGIARLTGNRRRPYCARKTVGYKPNGTPIYYNVGYYATRAEALQALSDFNKTSLDAPVGVTLATLYSKWLAVHRLNVTETTIQNYKSAYKHLHRVASIPLNKLTFSDLQDVFMVMIKNNLSYASRKKVKTLLSQLLQFAKINGYTAIDVTGIKIGKNVPVKPHKPLTRNRINKIWNATNNAIPLLLLYTGMRSKELRLLKKRNINLKSKTIHITQSKTASGIRVIPIHKRILPIVESLMRSPSDYLLGAYYTYNKLAKAFKKIVGGKHTTHDCRHTFATLLDDAGCNPVSKRKLLGHTGGDVTDKVYTHKRLRELRKAIELLA